MRLCKKCNIEKPLEEFNFSDLKKGWKRHECKSCEKAKHSKYYNENKEKYINRAAKWIFENRKKHNEYVKNHRRNNKEKINAHNAKWRATNPEKYKESTKKSKSKNPETQKKSLIKRAKMMSLSTPKDLKILQILAEIIRMCPEGHVVDHYYPILGKEVCGLNVPWNLQYLPIKENLRKNNKFPTEPIKDNLPEHIKQKLAYKDRT